MQKKLNRNFNYLKILFTLNGLYVLGLPLVFLLNFLEKISLSQEIILKLDFVCLVIFLVNLIVFIYLRIHIHLLTKFKYNKKDFVLLVLSFVFVSFAFGLATAFFFTSYVVSDESMIIAFYVIYPMLFLLQIIGSIFESISRVDELAFLNTATTNEPPIENTLVKKTIPTTLKEGQFKKTLEGDEKND